METVKRSRKNGSTKWIASWIIFFFSFSQIFSANGETTMYSSGMDETTTYSEPLTSTYISITPFLSTAPTTVAIYSTTEVQQCNEDNEFIQYGEGLDENFPQGDDNYIQLYPSIDVPINAANLGSFYLETNGYLTNGALLPFTPNQNNVSSEAITFMPLWTDIDLRDGGDLFYQVYDVYALVAVNKLTEVLGNIKTLFSEIAPSTFDPKWAIKVTWRDVHPFDGTTAEKLTFQFILATDGTRTYMAYLYENCDFSWLTSRNAIMGYVYPNTVYYHYNSSTPYIFDLRDQTNTNSKNGVFLFEMSTTYTINYQQRCLEWRDSNTPIDTNTENYNMSQRIPCPCTLSQATQDTRYTLGPNGCYYLAFLKGGYSKVCCYTSGNESVNGLSRGNVQVTSAILNETIWMTTDYNPYKDCCVESNYCYIYDEYRPIDLCTFYLYYQQLYSYGDPHITTVDGVEYTFNGAGEFEYLNVFDATSTSNVLMKIQCRTKQVGVQGNLATAFSAFVIQSEGVSVQLSERETNDNLKIFGDGVELTSFYTNRKYVWDKSPFYVAVNHNENDGYIIRHNSQTTISIKIENKILQFSINLGYQVSDVKTNGLLGTYNNNMDDDLETPTGVIIPKNETEKYIYNNFGLLWKASTSIFHYENSETQATYQFPNFQPSFLVIDKTSNEYKKALEVCSETDRNCIYDYIVTLNAKIAANTKSIEGTIAYETLVADKTSPTFNGKTNIIAYANGTTTFDVGDVTSTSSNLTLKAVEAVNAIITLLDKKVSVDIKLAKVTPARAAFQVYDEYGFSTPVVNLTVMICPICKHGSCDTSSVDGGTGYSYICKCDKGWRGATCNIDARCDPLGCPCTGPADNFTCDCPLGYEFKEKCVDIDECTNAATNNCSQDCLNTVGSYKCSCKEGYRLVGTTDCVDVNECQQLLSSCKQVCKNTIGGYECSCYPGYKLNGIRCDKDSDVCNNAIDCSNAAGCTLSSANAPTCFCTIGYTWNAASKKCDDVNECDTITCLNGTCVNTVGSYLCKCPIGTKLETDGRTCAECPHSKWGENCANTCSGDKCTVCNKKTGCICEPGYQGADCSTNINECNDPKYCNTSISVCVDTEGSAYCKCKVGFRLNKKKECVDYDECVESNDCSKDATCTNTQGSHKCECNNGFSGDGKTCTDINECLSNHPCQHTCFNQIGSFSCTCKGTAKLQDDRKTCKEDEGLTYEERLYIIIFSSIGGAIVIGLLTTLWIYCFGCCACCLCCGCCRRRRRRRRRSHLSDSDLDHLNVREAFGSVSSSLRGQLAKDGPFSASTSGAAKYLEDWESFSPYSENHRQGSGEVNHGWEDLGESTSSWRNIIHHFDHAREFRIDRPKIRPST